MILNWTTPPGGVQVIANQVHVWRAAIDQSLNRIDSLQKLLSEEEQKRAQRFVFQKDRNRFILARGLLRTLLGRYLEIGPEKVNFIYNSFGKPDLAEIKTEIRFNLSHSRNIILLAFTRNRHVGVDVEYIREDFAEMPIAERFFAPQEVAELQSLPDDQRTLAFFNCWTRKEAYIKAVGKGLSIPLDEFRVSLRPDQPAALLFNKKDNAETSRWRMETLDPGPDYVGAVAVDGQDWELNCWHWTFPEQD